MSLPDELCSTVLSYCDYPTRQRFVGSSKDGKRRAQRSDGWLTVRRSFCAHLLARAGAPTAFLTHFDATRAMPWIERRDLAYCGSTGYIDFLTPQEFGDGKPVLCGKDPAGRFYLAVSYIWRRRSGVACLFQRYSDDASLFVNAYDDLSEAVFSSNFSEKQSRIAEHHECLLKLATEGAVTLASGEEILLSA